MRKDLTDLLFKKWSVYYAFKFQWNLAHILKFEALIWGESGVTEEISCSGKYVKNEKIKLIKLLRY